MTSGSILIAENDPTTARTIEATLSSLEFSVAGIAPSGSDAVAIARRRRPDLVLMSVGLAGEPDGIEAGGMIAHELGIPVVYLTDTALDSGVDWSALPATHGLVTKPIDETALVAAIRLAIDRSDYEARLRANEGFLSAMFQAFPSPVIVVEADGTVSMCNQRALGTFQIECNGKPKPLGEIIRCTRAMEDGPRPCIPPCDRCDLIDVVREATEGRTVENRRCVIGVEGDRGVERLVLDVNATAINHDGQNRAVVVLEDRTEVDRFRKLFSGEHSFSGIVGRTPEIRQVFSTIREVADVGLPVLIQGETGTGKELVAHAIHDNGPRRHGPFVAVNCGAIPEDLLESELFGHVKGAFTGAMRDRQGRFTLAKGGTIFLDEIGDLSAAVQVKLLRVLQEQTYEPVGSERTLAADVRVVSATHKHLKGEVVAGRFRKDLYYRLCVLPINLPPLRRRQSDIKLIAAHLLARNGAEEGAQPPLLSREVIALFLDHGWPGNVRELDNILQFARIKCRGNEILPEHLPPTFRVENEQPPPETASRKRTPLDRESVAEAIAQASGNRTRAAKLLGVSRATLYRFLARNPE